MSPWVTGDRCDTVESNLTFAVIGVHCSTDRITCQLWDFESLLILVLNGTCQNGGESHVFLIFRHRIVTSIKLPGVFENTL